MNKRAIQTIFIVGIFSIVMSVFAGVSSAGNYGQVCTGLSSGKIDVSGSYKTIQITAPEGKLISRYCVKAGSVNNDLGPEYITVNPPVKTVVISHSSDKDISHYSFEYVSDESTTTTSSTSTSIVTTTTDTTTSTTSTSTTSSTTTIPTTTTTMPSTTTTMFVTTTTQPTTTTTSSSTTTSSTTTVPTTTTTVPSSTTIPTTTTVVTTTTVDSSTTEPEPKIMYQTIERLPNTGANEYILVAIGLLMLGVGCLAVVLSNKSNKVD